MDQQQANDSFKAEHAIEVGDGSGMDYTKDYIYGGDQSQYTEPESTDDTSET
ncbi:hypothetical protein [Paenibacillus puerhi]|uniref:hypothetical protein n=1 Tax=Paenibacillus puerhi TaxID=2692622 RepID=UPI001356CF32|nr:hypothetical protein [Paenibacillus puerhi]